MGVKRKIFGEYDLKEKGDDPGVTWFDTQKIAICKMRDFRSSFELDPYIREKLNFSYEEICDITDSWKRKYMEKYDPNGKKKICFYLSCFKIGVNDDGSDILVMNPYWRSEIVSHIFIDGSGARKKEYSVHPSDEPTLKKIDLWEIHEIVDGYIKLYHEPEYIWHAPDFVNEGDLDRGCWCPL